MTGPDPVIAALNARVSRLHAWLRLISELADAKGQSTIAFMAAAALNDIQPVDGDVAASRAVYCMACLDGVGTEALQKIAGLGAYHRAGAMKDLMAFHFERLKAAQEGEP